MRVVTVKRALMKIRNLFCQYDGKVTLCRNIYEWRNISLFNVYKIALQTEIFSLNLLIVVCVVQHRESWSITVRL